MKKGTITMAFLLIAAGLILFAGAFVLSGFNLTKLSAVKYETNTYTVSEDFSNIQISSKETAITFKPAEDGKFKIVCTEREKARHTVSVENGTLRISINDTRAWYDRMTIFSKALTMTVYLPADHYETLTIDSHTGDVSIPDTFTFGSLNVIVSTGDVNIEASADGEFRIKTSTGYIRTDGVNAAEIDLSASTGSITMKDTIASSSLNIEMGTGRVRLENCDAGNISIRTSTGDVSGTLLSEKIFTAKTSTGSIKVPDTASGGRCDITTSTGDINISLAK